MYRQLIAACVGLAMLVSPTCYAERYPSHPIKLIVASAAGGGNDFVARAVAPKVAAELGQPLIIENRGGAAGVVASELVAKADPDGYTLLLVFANFATFPSLATKMDVDVQKAFVPISNVARTPLVLAVSSTLPVKTVKDLIQLAKTSAKPLNYASPGFGSMGHMAGALFQTMANIKINQIPYRGGGPSVMALLGGQVQLYFSTPPAALAQMAAGRLRILGVTSSERAAFAPNIPTIAEAGLPGYEVDGWVGLLAPAGTPQAVIDVINKAFSDAVHDQGVQKILAREGVSGLGSSPAAFQKQLARDIQKWHDVIHQSGIAMQ